MNNIMAKLARAAARGAPTDAFDRERKGLVVCEKRCNECLFSSKRLADTDAIVADCERDGTYFLCHKGTIAGRAVICRGFFDYSITLGSNTACQVAHRLNVVHFIDPDAPER